MSDNKTPVQRRDFLIGAAAALATAAIPAAAATHHEHHHHHHGEHRNLVDAMEECVATGKTCLQHCLVLLGDGDTSMKDCAKKVNEMIPVCDAMATLALADSSNLKVLSEACLAVCKDCATACEEHMDKHQECKDCYDACKNSVAVVQEHVKAA
jgi:Cys-rich four helix bundle protein (predicted Tat secretion target)